MPVLPLRHPDSQGTWASDHVGQPGGRAFKNGRRHVAFYPLLKSLQVRLEQIRKLGIHLGAGPELDHFYNVLLA